MKIIEIHEMYAKPSRKKDKRSIHFEACFIVSRVIYADGEEEHNRTSRFIYGVTDRLYFKEIYENNRV